MGITTISSREFNRDSGKAKRAASDGPVFITDRGTPSYVLLTIEEYRRLAGQGSNLAATLGMPGLSEIDLEAELDRPLTTATPATFS